MNTLPYLEITLNEWIDKNDPTAEQLTNHIKSLIITRQQANKAHARGIKDKTTSDKAVEILNTWIAQNNLEIIFLKKYLRSI